VPAATGWPPADQPRHCGPKVTASVATVGGMKLAWSEIVARRLLRHHLTVAAADPAEAAAAMCGAHAQVLSAAEVSVALRTAGGTRATVQNAVWTDRSLVKTFGPRGTVHLLPTRDLAMWTGALAALPASSPFSADVRLTAAQTDEIVVAADDALRSAADGLTVDELTAAIVARTGPWAGDLVMPAFQGWWPRWRQALSTIAVRGALCFGPNRGRNVTYTSPTRWAPGLRPDPPAAAIRELVRRYLWAYGPATPAHLAQWLATSPAWMAALFADMAGELQRVEVDDQAGWLLAGDTGFPGPDAAAGLRLLPYFDAYAVGSHPRARVFPGRAAERALAGSQAGNFPVLLVDGLVTGVWHQRRAGRRLAVTVEPLRPLSRRELADLDDRVAELGRIQAATATLTVGEVTVGPHA
jgi:hypothetical protein